MSSASAGNSKPGELLRKLQVAGELQDDACVRIKTTEKARSGALVAYTYWGKIPARLNAETANGFYLTERSAVQGVANWLFIRYEDITSFEVYALKARTGVV